MTRKSVLSPKLFVLLLWPWLLMAYAEHAEHTAPPAGIATTYPAFDQHDKEQVAIAADPYNTPQKASLFKFKYLQYGFMPIRIIVTNNSDKPISLNDARINFITEAGDKLQTSEQEDVDRRMGGIKRPDSGYKLPGPLPRIGNKSSTKNKDVEADFKAFEYTAATVEAHTTQAGFLFYDVQGMSNPLAGAKLNLRMLRSSDGKELFAFDIPLDKYLATQGATAP